MNIDELLIKSVLIYGIVSLSHLLLQINLSHIYHLVVSDMRLKDKDWPAVGIVIPTYDEPYEMLSLAVGSCLNQQYGNKVIVVLVDDGSKDRAIASRVAADFRGNDDFVVLFHIRNRGKRWAQKEAFDYLSGKVEVIVTIDSDTEIAPDAVANMVRRFDSPTTGAVTGNVNVRNVEANMLTCLIGIRYWFAFNLERAAQSVWGAVLCCSGPLAAYRADLIEEVKEKYISQQFMGAKCTYGDDRHLTNLILKAGYKVYFEPLAQSWTMAPETFTVWLKQQLRWNKSFYREMGWTIKNILGRKPRALPAYVVFDMVSQTLMPFLLVAAVAFSFYRTISGGLFSAPLYLSTLIGVALMRSIIAYYRMGQTRFFIFPLYALLNIILLIPLRIYALVSLRKMGWGTR